MVAENDCLPFVGSEKDPSLCEPKSEVGYFFASKVAFW